VNGDNIWVLEMGSGFCLHSKAPYFRFACEVACSDHFHRHNTVQADLSRL